MVDKETLRENALSGVTVIDTNDFYEDVKESFSRDTDSIGMRTQKIANSYLSRHKSRKDKNVA